MENKIQQYLEGKLSRQEQHLLLQWIRKEQNREIFESVKKEWWKTKSSVPEKDVPDFGQNRLSERLKEKKQYERVRRYLTGYKYAAIFLLIISLSGGLFLVHSFLVPSSSELKFSEIHTGAGQVSGMTLPDGSIVWINSGTRLIYNNQYGISNRDIKVDGEAYFSVSKNKKLPFIVDIGLLTIEVTGTQFEVSNYEDSNTAKVVLEQGSVNIHAKNNKLFMQLSPDEMASFNKKTMTIEKTKVNPEYYTSWRSGVMHVFELPLNQVVLKLEKRYNQKFKVDPAIKDLPFTFSIETQSLPEVLYLLERIAPVKAVQQGDIIELKYNPKDIH